MSSEPSSELSLQVRDLGKLYRLGEGFGTHATLREVLGDALARARAVGRGREENRREEDRTFWALRDVSFDVERGEVLGVIGRNGAGKSTLLKILSRITPPTVGRIEVTGSLASLLEVGTGFHPELTGRENIFLNGAILGLKRNEISRKLESIVDFAGIEKFLDTPVKRYSSGMYIRLAFSVAAHLEPDILLVDEVLAVGDVSFQQKCLNKMQSVASSGRTVVFVSHNLGAVSRLCSRVLWLDNGRVVKAGQTAEVIGAYLEASTLGEGEIPGDADSDRYLVDLDVSQGEVRSTRVVSYAEPFSVSTAFRDLGDATRHVIALRLTDSSGLTIFTSWDLDAEVEERPKTGRATCSIPGELLGPGTYYVTVLLHETHHARTSMHEELSLQIEVSEVGYTFSRGRQGVIKPRLGWTYDSA